MAVRLDASTDSLKRTANLPSISVGASAMAWFYRTNDSNTFENLIAFEAANTTYDQIAVTDSSEAIITYVGGDGGVSSSGVNFTVGTWRHIAMAHNGGSNQFLWYIDSLLVATRTGDLSDFAGIWFGNDRDSELLDGRIAHAKCWDTQLTGDQMRDEMWSARPVHALASLNFYWPLWSAADTKDYGPNGRNPTIGGTLTTEDGPPVSNRRVQMGRYYKPAAGGGGGLAIPVAMAQYRQRWA